MSKGLSLHVGLNSVNPDHYAGWSGPLNACENDARDMKSLAEKQGYTASLLLTKDATRNSILKSINKSASDLQDGDIFLLTYSGHGGTTRDMDGEETTGNDSTWCLYDGQLVDDEIYVALGGFKRGVRIFVLSDSCHSGTVLRAVQQKRDTYVQYRAIPQTTARETYLKNKQFYDELLSKLYQASGKGGVKASALLISGCQDDQLSLDGRKNGAFTEQLIDVWNKGRFSGDYRAFYEKIRNGLPRTQVPNWFPVGEASKSFYAQKPFSIEDKSAQDGTVHTMPRERSSDDAAAVARLIELGSSAASCERLRERARQAMVRIYGKPTFKNACAATLSIFLQEAGIKIPLEYGAGRLAKMLRERGWQQIDVGEQEAGDVAVTEDNGPPSGADHIFLVVERLGPDKMMIADNQTSDCPHTRYASGRDGRTPCEYFLRAPAYARSRDADAEADPIEFVYEDEDTNNIVVSYDERGSPI